MCVPFGGTNTSGRWQWRVSGFNGCYWSASHLGLYCDLAWLIIGCGACSKQWKMLLQLRHCGAQIHEDGLKENDTRGLCCSWHLEGKAGFPCKYSKPLSGSERKRNPSQCKFSLSCSCRIWMWNPPAAPPASSCLPCDTVPQQKWKIKLSHAANHIAFDIVSSLLNEHKTISDFHTLTCWTPHLWYLQNKSLMITSFTLNCHCQVLRPKSYFITAGQ